jgi:O-antigen/teichoic acid export membrane protein
LSSTLGNADPTALSATTRRTARNAAVRAVAEVLGKVATLAWTLVAGRLLSQGDFGALAYALGVALLVQALPAWGFDLVLSRRGSSDAALVPRLYTEAVAWQLLLAVPVFGLTAAVALPFRPDGEARLALVLMLLAALPELWSDSARAAAAARQDQSGIATALLGQRIVTAVLIIGAVLSGGGVVAVSVAFLTGAVAGLTAHVVALRRLDVGLDPRLVSREGLRDMLRRSRALGLSAIVLMALFRVDVVILEAFRGDTEVAAYAVAYRLLETVLFITWAVNHAVFPVMSARADELTLRRGIERGTSAAAFVYLPFAAVCLVEAPAVIELLYGAGYVDPSAAVLRWLALAPLVYAVAFLGVSGLVARDRDRGMVVAALTALVVNVALNLAVIPRFGGPGAAAATTVSYVVEVAVVLLLLRPVLGRLRLLAAVREPLVAALVLALVLGLSPLPVAADLVVGAGIYLGTWWALARRTAPEQLHVLASLVPGRRKAA